MSYIERRHGGGSRYAILITAGAIGSSDLTQQTQADVFRNMKTRVKYFCGIPMERLTLLRVCASWASTTTAETGRL